MTLQTLLFLRQTLDRVQLNVGDPNFRDMTAAVLQALEELDHEIAAAKTGGNGPLVARSVEVP